MPKRKLLSQPESSLRTALCNPDLRPFLNKGALISSPIFHGMLVHSIAEYRSDRNWDPLRKIALAFERSKYFWPIVRYIADHANLGIRTKGKPGLRFVPLGETARSELHTDISAYLADDSLHGTFEQVKARRHRAAHNKRPGNSRGKSKPTGGDAMIRRVPGSFGTGRS